MDEGLIRQMAGTLRHRGPDDSGVLVQKSDKCVVGLGHTRLSILDLSEAGHQPMVFADLSIIFNGAKFVPSFRTAGMCLIHVQTRKLSFMPFRSGVSIVCGNSSGCSRFVYMMHVQRAYIS